jgi:hypothetical protein
LSIAKIPTMKKAKLLSLILFVLTLFSCKKDTTNQQTISIPNGDFELWDSTLNLYNWQTNSCPVCVPPFETYVVQKVTDAYRGQYAAKFIYNNVYRSLAFNKFAISLHPTLLTGFIKSNIENGDTATIHIDLFFENNIVDTGNFYETSSNSSYRKIEIPISQISASADSALIKVVGGKKNKSELFVDNLVFIKNR